MADDTPDLVQLAEKVGEQRDIAKETLLEIKQLDEAIAAEKEPAQQERLQRIRSNLLTQVDRLVANNNATIDIVSSTMGFIREWAKR
jgi:hypothetical protein